MNINDLLHSSRGIRTHCGEVQARWLHPYATTVPHGSHIIEIGAHHGYITRVLANAVRGSGRYVMSIDHMIGGWCDVERGADCWYLDYWKNLGSFVDTVIPFPMDSMTALHMLDQMVINSGLAYIDGDHSLERVSLELGLIDRLTVVDGVIAGDDCTLAGNVEVYDKELTFNRCWDGGFRDQFIYAHPHGLGVPQAVWEFFRGNERYAPLPDVPGNQFGDRKIK